jgi:beta-glucosidase
LQDLFQAFSHLCKNQPVGNMQQNSTLPHFFIIKSFIVFFMVFGMIAISCVEQPPYLNSGLSTDKRIDDLISRMTLDEKISQLRYDAPAIDRLGIPAYNWWNECLHGVARSGRATVFPQAIGLAATWDKVLMFRVATAISDEARAKHHDYIRRGKHGIYQGLTFWSPNINIFRDPRWGRGMETYGEDPYLTGQMGLQFVSGLQGDDPNYLKTVATVKHFAVHSGPEPDRHSFDARVSKRDLHETYLPHFRECIINGGARSIMCAYNLLDGDPCCGNKFLLEDVLRKNWGFDGYVVSDCWALTDFYNFQTTSKNSAEAGALALKAGTDLNCGVVYRDLQQAIDSGFTDGEKIDLSLKRILKARFQLGMFDPPEEVPYAQIPIEVNDCEKHRLLALETARESIVLLKNENNFLPLKKDLKSIAVIGPNADDVEVLLANYNGTPSDPVTLLRGIREEIGKQTGLIYARGCDWAEGMPKLLPVPAKYLSHPENGNLLPGLRGDYFDNAEMVGEAVEVKVAENISFNFWDQSPLEGFDDDNYSIRWTGFIEAPVDGTYLIGGFGSNYKIYFEDSLFVSYSNVHESGQRCSAIDLVKGEKYNLKVEAYDNGGDCQIELRWRIPVRDLELEALEAASNADVVIMCMGLSPRLEGEEMKVPVEGFEGGDRTSLDLPFVQVDLMKKVLQANKNVVLVLLNGSALSINWADDNIPAIVEAWYPGQAGGTAVADVLFGNYNPAGRLPVTFYKSVDDLPPFDNYDMDGRTYKYFSGAPLYPFGHGLSYTTFQYSNMQVPENSSTSENLKVSVQLKNTGPVAGDEVVQFYVSRKDRNNLDPICKLLGFERIHLEPGEEMQVEFTIESRQLSGIDENGNRVLQPGIFKVFIGGGQERYADGLAAEIEINGSPVSFRH